LTGSGLDDPVLGDRIERDAADVPAEVIAEIAEREPTEQNKAIQLLAAIMPQGIGRQRTNVLAVLLETAERLEAERSLERNAALAAARAIRIYSTESPLDETQLVGSLRIALTGDDISLVTQMFDDDRLLTTDTRLKEVAALYDRLPTAVQATVCDHIAQRLREQPTVLTDPLSTLPEASAIDLYSDKKIQAAVQAVIDATGDTAPAELTTDLVEGLMDSALPDDEKDTYPAQLSAILNHVLAFTSSIVYDAFVARRKEIRRTISEDLLWNRYVLMLWRHASAEDWEEWQKELAEGAAVEDRALATELLVRLFDGYASLPEDKQGEFPALVAEALRHLGSANEEDALAPVTTALERAQSSPWWMSEKDRRARATLCQAASLVAASVAASATEIKDLLAADLKNGLEQAGPQIDGAMTTVEALAAGLPAKHLKLLAGALPAPEAPADPQRPVTVDPHGILRTRASLAGLARDAGAADWQQAPFAIERSDVVAAIEAGSDTGDRAVAAWLRLEPSVAAVGAVLSAGDYRSSAPILAALSIWDSGIKRRQRTEILQRLLNPDRDTSALIGALAVREFNETGVIEAIRPLMEQSGSNKDQRTRLAIQAAALSPKTAPGERALADLIAWILDQTRPRWPAADIIVAFAALPGLGDRHNAKRKLDQLFRQAAPRAGRKLTEDEIAAFRRAGLAVPESFVKKSWRKSIMKYLG
jgi:hypothetical protein